MKASTVFATALGLLTVVSLILFYWPSEQRTSGKIVLVWATDENPARIAQVEAFNAEHPDILLTVDHHNLGTRKLIRLCCSGMGPDLMDYDGEWHQEEMVDAGILWDITDAARDLGFSVEDAAWPSARGSGLFRGRQYGYFCNVGVNLAIYNRNVFDHFGVPCPSGSMTWDEFINLALRVSEPVSEGKGASRLFALVEPSWIRIFESMGGELFTKEGLLQIANSKKLSRAMTLQRDLMNKYRLAPSVLEARLMSGHGGWGAHAFSQFAFGKYAMLFTGEWSLIYFNEARKFQINEAAAKGLNIDTLAPLDRPLRMGAVPFPHFPEYPTRSVVVTRMAGINALSPHREAALKVLQYFSGPTYSRLINQGMDNLPGNPAYKDLGVEVGDPELSRLQLHALNVQGMEQGYVMRRSPFFWFNAVCTAIDDAMKQMEANPDLTAQEALDSAESKLKQSLEVKLNRDPALKKRYDERVALHQTGDNSAE